MELCAWLLSWIIAIAPEYTGTTCPEIRQVSHEWLVAEACYGEECKVLGWYPNTGNTVYVDDRLDLETGLEHASIVLHEIVHYAQGEEGKLGDGCVTSIKAEHEAYSIQHEFLLRNGSSYRPGGSIHVMTCEEEE